MEDKKISGYPVFSDDDISPVVSSEEMTGLQPRPPADENELASYQSLSSTLQPENTFSNKEPSNRQKKPKRILPM